MIRRAIVLVSALALAAASSSVVSRASAASLPGPALDVPVRDLSKALSCHPFTHPRRDPVLLVHGTGLNAEQSWAWNYERVLPTVGFDVCAVTLPAHALGDIQVASEYVVYAIRQMAATAHRRVSVIGHSQGGLEPRWALRWWPDIPGLVSHYVGLASPNHGIVAADACVASGNCWPAVWQFAHGSKFLAALNRGGETPGATQYTAVYSLTDELVQPALPTPTAALAPAPNASSIAVQDVCPGRPVNHISMLDDAVVYAVVMRALGSSNPVRARQISPSVCTQTTMHGVTVAQAVVGNATTYADAAVSFSQESGVHAEPPLKSYAH
ncbi:MAG: lipase [Acidimicrobiia bacterium]|nr:lipase [Acidimicrobiia bacterium]